MIVSYPSMPSTGRFIYYLGYENIIGPQQIYRRDIVTGIDMAVTEDTADALLRSAYRRPQISPDGRFLVYFKKHEILNSTLMVYDLTDKTERVIKTLQTGAHIPAYRLAPDGAHVYVPVDGKISRIALETGAMEVIPFEMTVTKSLPDPVIPQKEISDTPVRVKQMRWINFTPDGLHAVFSALGKIWVTDIQDGDVRRLTQDIVREYAPAISPDGTELAYVTWSDTARGALKTVSIDDPGTSAILTEGGFFTNPVWSPDGSMLAYLSAQDGDAIRHFQYGTQIGRDSRLDMDVMLFDIRSGGKRVLATIQAPFIAHNRNYPPLQFSADGTRVFYARLDREAIFRARNLVSRALDGSDERVHLHFDQRVDHVVFSPDEHRLAVIRRNDVWLASLPEPISDLAGVTLGSPSLVETRLSDAGATYVHWQNASTLRWSFVNRVYQWRTGDQRPKEFATIDLRVPRAKPAGMMAFTGARIITMSDLKVIQDGVLLIENNRIKQVGPASDVEVPAGVVTIDLAGKTLIPGLIDVHHHSHSRFEGGTELYPQLRRSYIATLAYGVTTIFDPSAPTVDVFAQAEMVKTGELTGPRVFSTGDVVHPHTGSYKYVPIFSLEEARRLVRRLVDQGAWMIKTYGVETRNERQWLIQAGREAGVPVIGHAESNMSENLSLLSEGFSVIEHTPFFGPVYQDTVRLLARSGVHITPTIKAGLLVGSENKPSVAFSVSMLFDPKYLRYSAYGPTRTIQRRSNMAQHEPVDAKDEHLQRGLEDIAAVIRAGGRISVGSHSNDGLSFHWEMRLLADGGLSPYEILHAATRTGAEKLGLQNEIGSIEPGKLADLVVLNSNPLDNIRNSEDIAYVVKNGFVYEASSMTQIWPDYVPLPPLFWQSKDEQEKYTDSSAGGNEGIE